MGSIEQIPTDSYKNLLKDVAKSLGFFDPLYGSLNGDSSVACVVIFSSEGNQTYFKVGSVSMDVSESEESAAKHCLQALATDFALCLAHLNNATYEHCEQCERFFTFSSKVTGDVRGLYHDGVRSHHLALGDAEGIGCVEVMPAKLLNTSEDECVTPTNIDSRIPCSLPFHPKKRRVIWPPMIPSRSTQLIKLPPNLSTLFPRKKGGQ
jgi:hypothetical protein